MFALALTLAGTTGAETVGTSVEETQSAIEVLNSHRPRPVPSTAGTWQPQGPAPTIFGQVENVVPNDEVVGAVNQVVAHPTDPDVLFIGAANGGVWKTNDATSASPTWEELTDDKASLSIGALAADPYDRRFRRIAAGIGRFSSFFDGGERSGILYTFNGGRTWRESDGRGTLDGKNIIGIAPRLGRIVVAVDNSDQGGIENVGIFRGSIFGKFRRVSLGDGSQTGLPSGLALALAGDPQRPRRLFTAQVFSENEGGSNGIYRSDNIGRTWTKVSDAAIDALLISGQTAAVEITVGNANNVFVAIANNGALSGVFRSGDGGATWTALDVPATIEDGVALGVHPGFQAIVHFSLVADPNDPNIVYVGGDRQPFAGEGSGNPNLFFPNSIGAVDFSGRLFRGDASQPSGSQWVHLTHSNTLGPAGGGTASSSSPHADSRDMAFDALGNLIEVDDGGIYKRTLPQSNQGDWFSINGDLQTTEFHAVAYDSQSDTLIGGAQDTGVPFQIAPDQPTWNSLLTADGGDVAVDTTTTPNVSTRYSSNQFLGNLNRTFWDAGNNFLGFAFLGLQPLAGSNPVAPQFYTPIELNSANPARLVIGAGNSVYESLDQGDTVEEIGPGIVANGSGLDPIAYGTAGQPDVLYVGSADAVFVRDVRPNPLALAATFPGIGSGDAVSDIVIDPADGSTAFVSTSGAVYQTSDTGATWTDLTGNLGDFNAFPLRSITYLTTNVGDAVVVGGLTGAFIATESDGFSSWLRLGQGLPNVPVYDLAYDAAEDVLNVGTLGRGAWKFDQITATVLP